MAALAVIRTPLRKSRRVILRFTPSSRSRGSLTNTSQKVPCGKKDMKQREAPRGTLFPQAFGVRSFNYMKGKQVGGGYCGFYASRRFWVWILHSFSTAPERRELSPTPWARPNCGEPNFHLRLS